jgi:hypothetical protein
MENEEKNISFPKSIFEKMSESLGQDYIEDMNKVSLEIDSRMKISKNDFIKIKKKYGTVLGSVVDNTILNSEQEMPLTQKITSFIGEMAKSAKSGFKMASEEEILKRKSICQSCPHWNQNAFMGSGKCKICGCSGAKLWLATSSCPIKKWTATIE